MLALEGVSAGYGAFQALSGVSLRVEAGEAVGVIGPNGAGKTTLLRLISGLVAPTAGRMSFEGRPLDRVPPHRRPALGIAQVPEGRRLFPHLTVEENLRAGAFSPEARPHARARLAQVYGMFPRLAERARQAAGTLSGGEQQMCAIGRALMVAPRLLLLDEPGAGLAPLVVEQVFALVRRLRSEGYTVLIVEQNVADVLEVADRAYVLEAGRVVAEGTAEALRADPAVARAYLGAEAA